MGGGDSQATRSSVLVPLSAARIRESCDGDEIADGSSIPWVSRFIRAGQPLSQQSGQPNGDVPCVSPLPECSVQGSWSITWPTMGPPDGGDPAAKAHA